MNRVFLRATRAGVEAARDAAERLHAAPHRRERLAFAGGGRVLAAELREPELLVRAHEHEGLERGGGACGLEIFGAFDEAARQSAQQGRADAARRIRLELVIEQGFELLGQFRRRDRDVG